MRRKESSKGEASKVTVCVVEQLRSSFDSLKLSEEEKENPKVVNILKKPIKASKQTEEPKKAQEVQVAHAIQKAQRAKEAREARL